MFLVYLSYAMFMKYNINVETFVKIRLLRMDESVMDSEFCESITVSLDINK